ncbi:septal ring lytic transglycosylase RlpA family protein [Myxococcota bacterium]|nr:septal ring lytic transglycosylase RlpA family protein [Myxococcota bacterium]
MIAGLIFLLTLGAGCSHIERGKASYYGATREKTASGERVNPNAFTAAHRTLPFNSIVEVTAKKSGRSVRVRITDRGPYIRGRVIDLTPAAFKALMPLRHGVIEVSLRVIKLGKKRARVRRRHKKKVRRRHKRVRKRRVKKTGKKPRKKRRKRPRKKNPKAERSHWDNPPVSRGAEMFINFPFPPRSTFAG